MLRLVALALLGACGRIDFDPRADGGFGSADSSDGMTSDVPGACTLRQISVGERHICALREDGAVYCAGDNAQGQLGTGGISAAMPASVLASDFTSLGIAKSVHTGRQFTCVRDINGRVFCLGDNADHQLGQPTGMSVSPTHVAVNAPAMTPEVSLGNSFGCGITLNDEMYCWGDSDEGQDGRNQKQDAHAPEPILPLMGTNLSSLSAGTDHVCTLTATSQVDCWGAGTLFRLGYTAGDTCTMATAGTIACQPVPVGNGITNSTRVAAGHEHGCALETTNQVECWGSNDQAQAGATPSTQVNRATVGNLSGVTDLAAGRHHTCAIVTGGTVRCWGSSTSFELGSDTTDQFVPIDVPLPRPAVALATHPMARVTCALLDDSTASCWGANDSGQLGRGTQTSRELPAPFMIPCN